MKKSACLLALVAGAAAASIASAQEIDQAIPANIQSIRTIAAPGVALPGNYSQRLATNVFEYNAGGPFVYFAAYAGWYDDMRYNALLGATPDVDLDTLEMFLLVPAGITETGARIHVELYNTHTAGVFPPYTLLLHSQDYDFPVGSFVNAGAGNVGYDVVVGGWAPTVNTHDNTIGAYVQVRTLDGTVIHPSIRPVFVSNSAPTIGTSLGGAYIDVNNDGAIGTGEGPFVATGGTAMHATFILSGDIPVDPPASTTLTFAECTPSTTAVNLAAGEIKWFKFTVPAGGINAADLKALTIDTETAGSTEDTVLGIYDDRGNLLLVEDDDGTGALSQLSFGIGRWAGPGDGEAYDGRNGDIPAGDYYMAVTAFGAGLFFEEGFAVTPGASAASSFDLNVNYYSESCLPSLVAPTPDVDLGTILAPSAFPDALDMTAAVRWYKFNICTEIADPAKFLDFDFSPSSGDLAAVIFDANGNEVAFSDDADADANDGVDYFLPQFSFGNVGPRVGGGQGIGSDALAGQDGTLPPGDYYLAVGGYPYAILPEAASTTHGRFYFFATATGAADISWPFITTDVTQDDCDPVSSCPPCAADYDQDGGITGGDLGAFFADFEQGLPCADVDQDGGVTGGDLGVFFAAFEAGGC